MYELIIHHDTGIKREGEKLIKDPDSYGHVYLELKANNDSVVYGVLSGVELDLKNLKKTFNTYHKYIIHGNERLALAKEYENENPDDKILHSKVIEITEIQYLEAMVLVDEYEQYIGKEIPSQTYGLIFNNCAHFVNHIYRSMGLEGDYTRNYKTSELQQINTELTNKYKTLFGLYPGDKPLTVFGSSIEEVAKKYNVPKSLVSQKEAIPGVPDADFAIEQQAANQFTFVIAPNPLLVASVSSQEVRTPIHHDYAGSPGTDETDVPNKMIDAFKQGQELARDLLQEVPNHLENFQQQHGEWLASIAPGPNLAGFEQGRVLAQNLSRQGFPHTPELSQALGLRNTASHVFNPLQQSEVQTMGATSPKIDDEYIEEVD
jgi:hypothetical protein